MILNLYGVFSPNDTAFIKAVDKIVSLKVQKEYSGEITGIFRHHWESSALVVFHLDANWKKTEQRCALRSKDHDKSKSEPCMETEFFFVRLRGEVVDDTPSRTTARTDFVIEVDEILEAIPLEI